MSRLTDDELELFDTVLHRIMTRALQAALQGHELEEHGEKGDPMVLGCAEDVARRMIIIIDGVTERVAATAEAMSRADGTVH